MQDERNALIQTFELLKIEAARRNVIFSVVDLRWGITEEESRTGKVISVCLDETEKSHPFFIGILGSNYGTVPELSELDKNPELRERYDWVEEAINEGMSITEMEIQYGVLRNQNEVEAAFFFKCSDKEDNNVRLTALKDILRRKYDPDYLNDFSTTAELCEKVASAVRQMIDKHFGAKSAVTTLDRERSAQLAFIHTRHAYYFERQSYYDMIDDFVNSDSQHLVFTGKSGIGKSALLANWIKKNSCNPEFNLIYHFVGNSFSRNTYKDILEHFCHELYDLYDIPRRELSDGTIEDEIQRVLTEIPPHAKPVVFVIDGIDQIDSTKNEKLLLWLPSSAGKIKYIFSTLTDDETMSTFKRREYKTVEVLPMTKEERKCFASDYLLHFGKKLDERKGQLERIVSNKECENTLVLKTLLDELTTFGVYDKLDELIDYYLSSSSIQDFFDRVLQRMEKDYSSDYEMVRRALSLIAVSEHGLSEDELLSIIGLKDRPLDWHLFFCAFYNHFVVKNGIITFSHNYIYDAVVLRYHLNDKDESNKFRKEIIRWFSANRENSDRRTVYELGYQYYCTGDNERLYQLLMNFDSFRIYYETEFYRQALAIYWQCLLANDYHLDDYLRLPSEEDMPYLQIGMFAHTFFAAYSIALKCYEAHYNIYIHLEGCNNPNVTSALVNIGYVLKEYGDYEQALTYYSKALENAVRILGTDHSYVAAIYSNIGNVLALLGRYEDALTYQLRALNAEEAIMGTDHPETAATHNNIGGILYRMGAVEQSLEFHEKALKIYENCFGGDHPQILIVLNNIATAYSHINTDKALEIHLKVMAKRERVLGLNHTDTAFTYNNIGGVYKEKKDYESALLYYKKALVILEGNFGRKHPLIGISYGNVAQAYALSGDNANAIECYANAISIMEDTVGDNHPKSIKLYQEAANLLLQEDRLKEALVYLKKLLNALINALGTAHPETIQLGRFIAHLETL